MRISSTTTTQKCRLYVCMAVVYSHAIFVIQRYFIRYDTNKGMPSVYLKQSEDSNVENKKKQLNAMKVNLLISIGVTLVLMLKVRYSFNWIILCFQHYHFIQAAMFMQNSTGAQAIY